MWPGAEYRAATDDDETTGLGTLTGHFAVFDKWYEVDSAFEGRFMEDDAIQSHQYP